MTSKTLIRISLLTLSVAVFSVRSWSAEDGGALYKAKCAACHGPAGEGKPAMKAPALAGTKLTTDQIVAQITKGNASAKAPHTNGMSGVSDEQAQAIAEFVKTLK